MVLAVRGHKQDTVMRCAEACRWVKGKTQMPGSNAARFWKCFPV